MIVHAGALEVCRFDTATARFPQPPLTPEPKRERTRPESCVCGKCGFVHALWVVASRPATHETRRETPRRTAGAIAGVHLDDQRVKIGPFRAPAGRLSTRREASGARSTIGLYGLAQAERRLVRAPLRKNPLTVPFRHAGFLHAPLTIIVAPRSATWRPNPLGVPEARLAAGLLPGSEGRGSIGKTSNSVADLNLW